MRINTDLLPPIDSPDYENALRQVLRSLAVRYEGYAVLANYTFTDTDEIETLQVDATAGNITITLPLPVGIRRRRVIKTDVSSNTVTVTAGGTILINDATTHVLSSRYSGVEVTPTGTKWLITEVVYAVAGWLVYLGLSPTNTPQFAGVRIGASGFVISNGAGGVTSNIVIGSSTTGDAMTTATDSVILGTDAGTNVTSGGRNVIIGRQAGATLSTRTNCVVIGYLADASNNFSQVVIGPIAAASGGDNVSIGNNAHATNAYAVALGYSAYAGHSSVAIGRDASADVADGTAIGAQAIASAGCIALAGGSAIRAYYNTNYWRMTGGVYATGAYGLGYYDTNTGGAVTQVTSRVTGVTLNKVCGAITLFSDAGTATWQTFTVTNSVIAATDTILVNQKSGTDLYMIHVTTVAAGSFNITFATTGGTTVEQPVFNFAVIKAVAS